MKDMQKLTNYIQTALSFASRYAVTLVILVFAVACGYIITLASSLTQQEPSQAAVNDQLKSVPRPRISDAVAERMLQLESQNVDVQAIFQQARDNPFNE